MEDAPLETLAASPSAPLETLAASPSAPLETLAASPSAPSNGAGFMYGTPSMLYISWAEPDNSGGAPITNYLLTLTPDDQPAVEHLVQAPIQSYMEAIECTSIRATVKATNDNGLNYGPEYIFPLITYIHVPPLSTIIRSSNRT